MQRGTPEVSCVAHANNRAAAADVSNSRRARVGMKRLAFRCVASYNPRMLPLLLLSLASQAPIAATTLAQPVAAVSDALTARQPSVVTRPGPVFNGRAGNTAVNTPRMDAKPEIDGMLDESAWDDAALLTGFSQYFPNDGAAALDSTEIFVWYSATALHLGVKAFAATGTVRATLSDRDKISQDDNIQFFLGTYNDSRQALVFGVNPLGNQSDGVLTETGASSGGGFSGGTPRSRETADLAPDYVWQSKGRLTDFGYEVEISIPFKSLRYSAGDEQQWQLHVIRTVQASGREQSWVPAQRAQASFLAQSGLLTGLRDLRRGLTLDIIPTITANSVGSRVAGTDRWAYETRRPELGGSARWGITSNLTLAATANPDFSQVEADATQFTYDPRVAVFFAERRPFFLESQEQFSTPNRLIYTRRISQPVGSVKLTGKSGGFDIGVLSAVDSKEASPSGEKSPIYNILRIQRDVGGTSRVGLAYTDKVEGDRWNRVLGLDGRFVRGIVSAQGQFANSFTGGAGATASAPLWDLSANLTGQRFYARYAFNGISPGFDAQSGFISRTGIANVSATHRYNWFGQPGTLIEAFIPEAYLGGVWQYESLVNRGNAQDIKSAVRTNTRFRGGWQLGVQALIESFGYDPSLYANYRLLTPRAGGGLDTTGYVGTKRLPNLDWVFSLTSPEFQRFSFNTTAILGRDENFPEWTSAGISSLSGSLNVRPTQQLRLTGTVGRDEFSRVSDRTRVQLRSTMRLRAEYQLTRQMFIRFIGEHAVLQQDSLRDDSRTNLPIYLLGSNGTLTRAAAFQHTTARLDVLFSYLPTPGTVLYAGYGDALRANEPIGPARLERTQDVFFTKFSYLFRVR